LKSKVKIFTFISEWLRTSSNTFKTAVILIIVLFTRLPFLSIGYGLDVDAWRAAGVGRDIFHSGHYILSRAPGHPVQELIYALLWNTGYFIMNGLTAIISVIAVFFFVLILRELGFKKVYLPALAFALTPVIFINSVNTLDHIWALAFIIAGMYFVMRNKPVSAGILLGFAGGCRLTSLLMIIPFFILLYLSSDSKINIRNLFKFTVSAGITSIVLFLPVIFRYGFDMFDVHQSGFPGISFIAYRIFITVWGLIGICAVITACIIQFYFTVFSGKNKHYSIPKWGGLFDVSLFLVIILYSISFALLPHKAAYLIPIVPFVLILLGRFLNYKLYNFVCISLIISPFLLSVNRTDSYMLPEFSGLIFKFSISGVETAVDLLNGPVILENSRRQKQMDYVNNVIAEGSKLTQKSVVVTGEYYPLIDIKLPYNKQGNVVYEYYLDSANIKYYKGNGYDVYYLPPEEEMNLQLHNINLDFYGGKSLFER